MSRFTIAFVSVVVLACAATVHGEVVIATVPVGNPGNTGELSGECVPDGYGPCRECGAVDYVYNIGKVEVTAGQYAKFLNAVAADDTYGVYSENMDLAPHPDLYGCNIVRTGSSPNYNYSVAGLWTDQPVNWVSWGSAARFCNWLHNGQPTGPQDLSTTEDGSYFLNGATTNEQLLAVVREPDATWVIPSEDEWYKAAYHYNDGVTGNYYDYPTSTDAVPNNGNPEGDTGNSANFYDGDYTVGGPYWRTEVGFFGLSDSPYGTFDQGGNVWEWNEGVLYGSYRGLRGGSFRSDSYVYDLHAATRRAREEPNRGHGNVGFRVTRVNCNNNNIEDHCDIDCGLPGGECDVDGCGQSQDVNGDGIPDECGACCGSLGGVGCLQLIENPCGDSGGVYLGDETVCEGDACPIPTVSEWGLVVMTLLLLGAGVVVLTKRRKPSTA